ncbi:serine protein kinase RIO [Thermogladius sp. 4427co]|uniref:serine protein kinase RIO n=1 Tax=Thermogladius sp. 4427co TaxID=3450718 RepID=UPI003F79AD7C
MSREERREKDKDLFETVEEVFDTRTVLNVVELMRRKVIKRLAGTISAGKESRIYLGYTYDDKPVAVKIYLTSSAEFKKGILKYIAGDPRFEGFSPRNTRELIYAWARKEFRNLTRMYEAGVRVPKPLGLYNNVLVMEFIGEDRHRYPLLVEAYEELEPEELEIVYNKILEEIEKIVCKARLVHGDLSEYNIMVTPDLDVVIIDVSQAVDVNHPNALDLLKRDLERIEEFFRDKIGLNNTRDSKEVLEGLMKCLEKRKGE